MSFTGAVDFVKNHGLYLLLLETPSGFSFFSLCGVYIHLPDAIQVGLILWSFFLPFWLNNIYSYVLAYSCRCVPLYYPEYLGDVRYLQVCTWREWPFFRFLPIVLLPNQLVAMLHHLWLMHSFSFFCLCRGSVNAIFWCTISMLKTTFPDPFQFLHVNHMPKNQFCLPPTLSVLYYKSKFDQVFRQM